MAVDLILFFEYFLNNGKMLPVHEALKVPILYTFLDIYYSVES